LVDPQDETDKISSNAEYYEKFVSTKDLQDIVNLEQLGAKLVRAFNCPDCGKRMESKVNREGLASCLHLECKCKYTFEFSNSEKKRYQFEETLYNVENDDDYDENDEGFEVASEGEEEAEDGSGHPGSGKLIAGPGHRGSDKSVS